MHPNPAFRRVPPDARLAFARARGFGVLTLAGPDGPLAAHVPFVLDADGRVADLHLARSNPILRELRAARPALLAVSGPDGYVSPDWYGLPDQVPTWNYVAVHLRGTLERRSDDTLRAHLDDLSAAFETRLPKTPWTAAKMTPDALDRMMRSILPVRLTVTAVDGTWKLGQNKAEAARLGAAAAMAGSLGQELATLAAWMRDPPG